MLVFQGVLRIDPTFQGGQYHSTEVWKTACSACPPGTYRSLSHRECQPWLGGDVILQQKWYLPWNLAKEPENDGVSQKESPFL